MRRYLLTTACILLLPALASATSFTASLAGGAGSGFGTLNISGTTIDYSILVSGFAPTTASLTRGGTTIDLGATFTAGTAIGSTTSNQTANIIGNPGAWTLTVSGGGSSIAGPLAAGGTGDGTVVYFPVSAAVRGAAGTNFRTDLRIVNRGSTAVAVTLDYYAAGADANTAPDATDTVDVAPNEQLVLNDFVAASFGVTNGRGGVQLTADGAVEASSRVYNDQSAAGEGTFGLFVDAVSMDQALSAGLIPFLQNRPAASGAGFRGAIGWFNPTASAVTVTFRGWDTDGTLLGETSRTINALSHDQLFVNQLWAALADYGDMYVTFEADGELFIYGTITDNISGDGTYLPAAASN
ncbi:MAG: hypothetical protein MUE90_08075 [Thermoanaerobaculales bacterium]|nr:hypothetical protein [Thermoanaerobaculales bacterium]